MLDILSENRWTLLQRTSATIVDAETSGSVRVLAAAPWSTSGRAGAGPSSSSVGQDRLTENVLDD